MTSIARPFPHDGDTGEAGSGPRPSAGDFEGGEALSLIARLRLVTGPDTSLDAEIFAAVAGKPEFANGAPYPADWTAPAYTGSVDQALKLIPLGIAWELHSDSSCMMGYEPGPGRLLDDRFGCEGASLPLTLCISALRARGFH